MEDRLPPMPGSDEQSLSRNRKDGYYEIGARDFWQGNVIERIEDKPMVKCDHEFIGKTGGVECKKCHFGFPGQNLQIKEGKLFFKGEQLPI